MSTTAEDELGPIDYLVVEYPNDRMSGEGLPLLVDLVDRGLIRILDLVFLRKESNGALRSAAATDFDGQGGVNLAIFDGASSGLLGDDDLSEAGAALEPGTTAAIMVYENRWAAPFVAALRRGGAQLVASGRIPLATLIDALEMSE